MAQLFFIKLSIKIIWPIQVANSIIQNHYTQFLQHVLLIVDISCNIQVLHLESGKCIYPALEVFSTMDTYTHTEN